MVQSHSVSPWEHARKPNAIQNKFKHFIDNSGGKKTNKKRTHLSLPVDTNDARSSLMKSGDKDGLPADSVHVDASASFKVVQVDVAIFGDEKDHVLLGADLQEQNEP